MALSVELLHSTNTYEEPRVGVSYTTHELDSRAFRFPHRFMGETGEHDMAQIAESYGEVILGVTDLNLRSKDRQKMLVDLVQTAKDTGLTVTADLWNLGGNSQGGSLTGGEGVSLYGQGGGELCACPDSGLPSLTDDLLKLVRDVGIQRMFWDEPALDCRHIEAEPSARAALNAELSFDFLQEYTARANEYGITWNEACVRWRETDTPEGLAAARNWAFRVASIADIAQLSAAPYPLHPGNTSQKSADQVIPYIRPAYQTVASAATLYRKTARGWVQGFNISEQNLEILRLCFEEVGNAIGRIAVWSHNGSQADPSLNSAASLPPADIERHVLQNIEHFRENYTARAAYMTGELG